MNTALLCVLCFFAGAVAILLVVGVIARLMLNDILRSLQYLTNKVDCLRSLDRRLGQTQVANKP